MGRPPIYTTSNSTPTATLTTNFYTINGTFYNEDIMREVKSDKEQRDENAKNLARQSWYVHNEIRPKVKQVVRANVPQCHMRR